MSRIGTLPRVTRDVTFHAAAVLNGLDSPDPPPDAPRRDRRSFFFFLYKKDHVL